MSVPTELPVAGVLPAMCAALEQGRNVVLVAPPGAGKTTLTPLVLRSAPWLPDGHRILLVEPRRVAVRNAAYRMASSLEEPVGGTVGFRTRTESALSGRTRIEVVTEGLLLRRLLADPLLDGVGAVLFDEVHERSLDLDAALAFCLDLQRSLRPELRLVAMSATPDGRAFTTLMQAVLVESEGRQHPIAIRHTRDLTHLRDLPKACASAVRQALLEEEGSILVFLPGVGEIRRTQALLDGVNVYPLHGEQGAMEQDRALVPSAQRRVVLATSIAETSVTVAGVRVVIDGGWRRAPRLDPNTGLSRLETVRISRATATQRAGRAGRQEPGVVIRLWSEATQRTLRLQDVPEMQVADLADFGLVTAAWFDAMGTSVADLPLLNAPPSGVLAAGMSLLHALGAVDAAGADHRITALGRRMVALGTHPRLAAMLCAARSLPEQVTAAYLAALLEERDPLRPRSNVPSSVRSHEAGADIRARLALCDPTAMTDRESAGLRSIHQAAHRFLRRTGVRTNDSRLSLRPDSGPAGALLAAGFPDRIAQAAGEAGRFRLSGSGSARLPKTDLLARERLLVAAALHTRTATEITLAAPLDAESLPETLLERTHEQVETSLDGQSERIIARRRLRLGTLVLRDRNVQVSAQEAQALLVQQVAQDPLKALVWSDAVRQFQARVALARQHGRALPDISDEALCVDLGWLAPYLAGCDRLSQAKAIDLLSVLRGMFAYEDMAWLDREVPSRIALKAGGTCSIDYTAPVPTVSARAQAFYGTVSLPRLMGGAVPLQCALLSPAGRSQAITSDLAGFWAGGWAEMRRAMRGRYPRHDWPENPGKPSGTGSR